MQKHSGSHLIAGAMITSAGAVTIGLAAIADVNIFATVIGLMLVATGVVILCSVWIPGTSLAQAMWQVLETVGAALAAPFRAYARLYRSQWRASDGDESKRVL